MFLEAAFVGPTKEFPLPAVGPVDPGARWEPSSSPLPRVEEDVPDAATAMVVVPPEEASGGVAVAGGTSIAPADVSPAEGDARDRTIVLGEENAEDVLPPMHEEPSPAPLVDEAELRVAESSPRPPPTQANHGAAPSGRAESALALIPVDAGPSNNHGLREVVAAGGPW